MIKKGVSTVKKFIVFLVSFIFLFILTQVISGMFLTAAYSPDINEAWRTSDNLPQEVVLVGDPHFSTLIFAVLSATIAYFMANTIKRLEK